MQLSEVKEWLKIDTEDEDITLSSLIFAAQANIENATGIKEEYILNNEKLLALYNLAIKVWITFMYGYDAANDKSSSSIENFNRVMNGFYLQLEAEYLKLLKADAI